jgi:predicted transposase YdaD
MVSAKWDIDEALQVSKEEGRTEGILETFKGLVKDGTLTIETAAKKMGVTVADFRKMAML